MLSQEVEEKLAERLVNRIEEANSDILKKIGESIKQISKLTPTQAHKLGQILKYGGDYKKIAKILADVSGKNVQDIYTIFAQVAKENKEFAREFYKYRNLDFIPYSKDKGLQRQVDSIAKLTADTYANLVNTKGIGFLFEDIRGQMYFKDIQQAYNEVIDRAVLSIAQGKETFQNEMRRIMKQMGNNGMVVYESGRTRRLDSAARMNILDGIRMLNNETSKRFGAEYDADGVEISVHANPAPDHADIQGRQFKNKEYDKLEAGKEAVDVDGVVYDGNGRRQISTYNCYHKIFPIVVGVSQPEYTDEELAKINQRNTDGFEFEGKHYTMYQGTQMQRKLELEARKQKDINILAKASGDTELVKDSEIKIRQITQKYKELNEASGLAPKKQRMSVSGYRRTHVDMPKPKEKKAVEQPKAVKLTPEELDEQFYMYAQDLKEKNVEVDNSIFNIPNKELRNQQLQQLDVLTNKYNHNEISRNKLKLRKDNIGGALGLSNYGNHSITLSNKYFNDKDTLLEIEKQSSETKWHTKVAEDKYSIYTITHEYGHIVEYEYTKEMLLRRKILPAVATRAQRAAIDKELQDTLLDRAMEKLEEKMTRKLFKEKYWSKYAKSKRNFEWFAESFAEIQLTENSNVWIDTFKEWLDEYSKQ